MSCPLFLPFICPFISSKMPHFWPLIFLVLPLFEMWQLCNSEHLINFFFSYLGNTYIFGKKYHHQSFIDFRYGLFSTQWPQYDAHILQRLISKRFSCCSVEQCFFFYFLRLLNWSSPKIFLVKMVTLPFFSSPGTAPYHIYS